MTRYELLIISISILVFSIEHLVFQEFLQLDKEERFSPLKNGQLLALFWRQACPNCLVFSMLLADKTLVIREVADRLV